MSLARRRRSQVVVRDPGRTRAATTLDMAGLQLSGLRSADRFDA